MHPVKFETEADLERERGFVSRIEEKFKCRFHKLPIDWQFDGILSRNDMGVAFAEIKTRNVNKETYSDIVLSYHKTRTALSLSKYFGNSITGKTLPFVFFVRFLDGDYQVTITEELLKEPVLLEPQNHPGHDDKERVIKIPGRLFKPF